MQIISKSQLKSQLLEFLRKVEKDKQPLIITHLGEPVAQITPYQKDPQQILKLLRGSVTFYKNPTQPVGVEDWEVLK